MSSFSSTASTSSSSSVAGQQLWSSKASQDLETTSSDFATTISMDSWDVQEIEITHSDEEYESSLGSPPETPDLLWDSRPSSGADFSGGQYNSVFEDWDETPSATTPPVRVVEEDGSQILLIPAESEFFNPPPTPKPFGFAHLPDFYSNSVIIIPPRRESIVSHDELSPTNVARATPAQTHRSIEQHDLSDSDARLRKGLMLFVDTTLLHSSFGGNGAGLSSPFHYSPGLPRSNEEASSWTPKNNLMCGPDVPLDCIYSAGDISPIERWDEPWSPVLLTSPLHTSSCISHTF